MPRHIFKQETEGLCSECLVPVAASIYSERGEVFMEKDCPEHGRQVALIEKDSDVYRNLSRRDVEACGVEPTMKCLVMPVEYRCELKCFFCALPYRTKENPSLEEIAGLLREYEGTNIELSGGEPTLREELPEIIRMVKDAGKKCVLVTSGLRLAHRDYVEKLKEAGLDQVFISLYSGTDEIEMKMCGRDVLPDKLGAMRNIRDAGINLAISAVIVPGVNEKDIGGIFRVAFENEVKFMSMRAAARVGDYANGRKLYISELAEDVSQALGVGKQELVTAKKGRWTPYFFYLRLSKARNGRGVYVHRDGLLARLRNAAKYVTDVGVLKSLPALGSKFRGEGLFQVLHLRLASWPDRFDFDSSQVAHGKFDHVYAGKPMEIFKALILSNDL